MECKQLSDLKIKIFADGANKPEMLEMYANPFIQGLTTNPTLMREAGIQDYSAFAQDMLALIKDKPISFEVFADDFLEMERQAHEIANWGDNVYVKIPITNTQQKPSYPLIAKLATQRIKMNITAVMTLGQVRELLNHLTPELPSYISIFAGRIADTGRDPIPLIKQAVTLCQRLESCEIIWASPREFLNIFQADECGCHIITVKNAMLQKMGLIGYDLEQYSLDTIKMFYDDAKLAGYWL
jgi:transaldolase